MILNEIEVEARTPELQLTCALKEATNVVSGLGKNLQDFSF
jgi:hypothetical protein